MLKLKFNKTAFGNGEWGKWAYGKDKGSFGRNPKGMWAKLDGCIYLGLETYENDVTDKFKVSLIKWRKINQKFDKYVKRNR